MKELRQIKNIRGIVTRLVLSALVFLSLFVAKQVIVHYQMDQEENTSAIINISGRQRMLSQKITKDIAFIHFGEDTYLTDLRADLDDFQRMHQRLMESGASDRIIQRRDNYIMDLYEELDPTYQEFIELTKAYLAEYEKAQADEETLARILGKLQQEEALFLTQMDEIVFTYEEEAKQALIFIQQTNFFLFVFILIILVFVTITVFIPLINHTIQSYFQMRRIRTDLIRVLENMEGFLFLVNREGEIIFLNEGAKTLLIDQETKGKQSISEQIHWVNFNIHSFINELGINDQCDDDSEVLVETPEGQLLPLSLTAVSGHYNGEGVIVLTLHDLTKQKEAEEILKKIAFHDELTGLYNRHGLETILEQEFSRADRYDIPLTVTLLDLDHFKQVNDDYGHPVGDAVLQLVAETIDENIRASDYAVRIGGEEILVFLPNTNRAEGTAVAEKLRKKLAVAEHPEAGQVTASFGVVERQTGEDYLALYKRVDDALYQAKEKGRNRVEVL